MYPLIKILGKGLDSTTQQRLYAHVDSLMSGIHYEAREQTDEFLKAKEKGWDMEKLTVLCCLNAFYQLVLGPLTSVSKSKTNLSFFKSTPIAYGEIHITAETSESLSACHTAFIDILTTLTIDPWWLTVNHGHDLLYKLAKSQTNDE